MRSLLIALLLFSAGPAFADPVRVAVAANFKEPIDEIAGLFAKAGHEPVQVSVGSTGQLYAQIANGAPFDVFFAADQARPIKALEQGFAVAGSRFTYAVGVLTLYSPDPDRIAGPESLEGDFRTLAIANPVTAPYGAAAKEVLDGLGLWDTLEGRIARAQNIGGAFAAVRSGAAEMGFVALSSVLSPNNDKPGSRWDPPQSSYSPLAQDAVLLIRAQNNPDAQAFLAFVRGPEAQDVIRQYGYGVE